MPWFVGCLAKDVSTQPKRVFLHGEPIVLFRTTAGKLVGMTDRCPHRNVPLSLGTVCGERIRCAYHGWEFDQDGQANLGQGTKVETFAVKELQGFVWIYAEKNQTPHGEPFRFPEFLNKQYGEIRHNYSVESTLFDATENMLDVTHTTVLHRGLFRSESAKTELKTEVRQHSDLVEAEYFGEARPEGWLGKLLAPKGGEVRHIDRFIWPSITQVEYSLGQDAHILATAALTPAEEGRVVVHAQVLYRTRIPNLLVRLLGIPLAKIILRQDARMLSAQRQNIAIFGRDKYSFTSSDILGPAIFKMLKR